MRVPNRSTFRHSYRDFAEDQQCQEEDGRIDDLVGRLEQSCSEMKPTFSDMKMFVKKMATGRLKKQKPTG